MNNPFLFWFLVFLSVSLGILLVLQIWVNTQTNESLKDVKDALFIMKERQRDNSMSTDSWMAKLKNDHLHTHRQLDDVWDWLTTRVTTKERKDAES